MSGKKTILVCGGAGYIGSHMARRLQEAGHEVIVFDNLSTGHAKAVEDQCLVQGDIRDRDALDRVFAQFRIDAAMHFCASSLVGESIRKPLDYWENNLGGSLVLIDAMCRAGVGRLVFSSTAAVFGEPLAPRIDEDHPRNPVNPYGASKRAVEDVLAQLGESDGFRSVSLRYFNAAGASLDGRLGESHHPETHLIPNVLRTALGQQAGLKVFGDDYPTPDGSCVRDYVHVLDLVEAHLLALEAMDDGLAVRRFNLGNGEGYSVLDVIRTTERLLGHPIDFERAPRRPGDPPALVADSRLAREVLGWNPRHAALETIIDTALRWHRAPRY
jgi:UDP-glucose 4-epimerase